MAHSTSPRHRNHLPALVLWYGGDCQEQNKSDQTYINSLSRACLFPSTHSTVRETTLWWEEHTSSSLLVVVGESTWHGILSCCWCSGSPPHKTYRSKLLKNKGRWRTSLFIYILYSLRKNSHRPCQGIQSRREMLQSLIGYVYIPAWG